jgi:flavin-dependent dehydrogenase
MLPARNLNASSDSGYDLRVIGAGISGISLARSAAGERGRALVIEKAAEPGRCFSSIPWKGKKRF